MLMTFKTTLKVLIRDRDVLMWAIAFPLVLSTLFQLMFSNLDEIHQLDPIPVVVVEDANYDNTPAFREMIDSLSGGSDGESPLIAPAFVPDEQSALHALREGAYKGYLLIDAEGTPSYYMDTRRADSTGDPSQSIITSVLNRYTQNAGLIAALLHDDPELLAEPGFLASLSAESEASFTERVSVTANPPSDSLRYYYAVLAFSTIMMSTIALTAVELVLANTSPLGARRSLGGQSKVRTLVPTLAASWLLGFACVMVGFLYLRLVFDVGFGGKEPLVVVTLAVSTLAATLLGTLLATLPMPSGAKGGVVAFLSCALSLFAGLYGPFSQDIGDYIARELPLLSACNPVRQVADAFFSLYYYDGYTQLAQSLMSLLVFCAVFFVLSVLFLRRQRYASL